MLDQVNPFESVSESALPICLLVLAAKSFGRSQSFSGRCRGWHRQEGEQKSNALGMTEFSDDSGWCVASKQILI